MDHRSFCCLLISLFISLSAAFSQSPDNAQEKYIYRSGDQIIISDAERIEGTIYKVEVARLPVINPDDPEMERLKKYGRLYTETIDNKDIKALLIGNFDKKKKAVEVKNELQKIGFTSAVVITYKNGLRQS